MEKMAVILIYRKLFIGTEIDVTWQIHALLFYFNDEK